MQKFLTLLLIVLSIVGSAQKPFYGKVIYETKEGNKSGQIHVEYGNSLIKITKLTDAKDPNKIKDVSVIDFKELSTIINLDEEKKTYYISFARFEEICHFIKSENITQKILDKSATKFLINSNSGSTKKGFAYIDKQFTFDIDGKFNTLSRTPFAIENYIPLCIEFFETDVLIYNATAIKMIPYENKDLPLFSYSDYKQASIPIAIDSVEYKLAMKDYPIQEKKRSAPYNISTSEDTVKIFTSVEIPAQFNGSYKTFLEQNLRYPDLAVAYNIQGVVSIQCVVDKNGMVSNLTLDDTSPCRKKVLVDEAIRIIQKSTGKWKPGMQNNLPVMSYHSQSINFVLAEE